MSNQPLSQTVWDQETPQLKVGDVIISRPLSQANDEIRPGKSVDEILALFASASKENLLKYPSESSFNKKYGKHRE